MTVTQELTGVRPDSSSVPPELAVALGAAVQAGMLEGSVDQLDVFNVPWPPFELETATC